MLVKVQHHNLPSVYRLRQCIFSKVVPKRQARMTEFPERQSLKGGTIWVYEIMKYESRANVNWFNQILEICNALKK